MSTLDISNFSEYHKNMKELTDFLESSKDADILQLDALQKKLDDLGKTYQHDDKLGANRYLLYHTQAFLHYRYGRFQKAVEFMESAINIRGYNYDLAHALIEAAKDRLAELGKINYLSKQDRRKRHIGLEGWLAIFIAGLIFGLILTIFRFFNDGFLTSADLDSLNTYEPGLGYTFQTITALENVAVLIALFLMVITLVTLFQKLRLARSMAIITMIYIALYGVADYLVVSYVLESSGLNQEPFTVGIMASNARDVSGNVIAAMVWVPYLFLSKRVKSTLVE